MVREEGQCCKRILGKGGGLQTTCIPGFCWLHALCAGSQSQSPDICQISWVTADNFDPEKVSLQSSSSSGDVYERHKIMYQYEPDVPKRDLVITVPRIPEAYITYSWVDY